MNDSGSSSTRCTRFKGWIIWIFQIFRTFEDPEKPKSPENLCSFLPIYFMVLTMRNSLDMSGFCKLLKPFTHSAFGNPKDFVLLRGVLLGEAIVRVRGRDKKSAGSISMLESFERM